MQLLRTKQKSSFASRHAFVDVPLPRTVSPQTEIFLWSLMTQTTALENVLEMKIFMPYFTAVYPASGRESVTHLLNRNKTLQSFFLSVKSKFCIANSVSILELP